MKLQSLTFLMLALLISSLQAADSIPSRSDFRLPEASPKAASDSYTFDLSCYGGFINGLTKEIVFSETKEGKVFTCSQLDWKIQDLWVIGGRVAMHFFDQKCRLIMDGWGKAASRESVMVDRDWDANFSFKTPVHISVSNSLLKSAYKITGEFGYDFHQTNFGLAQLQTELLAGYQYFELAWIDNGGVYVYNNGADIGFLPIGTAVSYSQEYSIPYFGLAFNGKWEKLIQWSCYGKVSNSTFVHQKDIHHLRGLAYDEEIPYGTYWMVGTSLSISFSEYLDCNVKYGYEQMNETKGKMTVYKDNKFMGEFSGSGVYHRHQTLSLGISSTF